MWAAVPVLKPLVIVWASLNAIDDLAILFRIARLGTSVIRSDTKNQEMCDICDDVMGDLMKVDGLSIVPCEWACFKLKKCTQMCQQLRKVSGNSTIYPVRLDSFCHRISIVSASNSTDSLTPHTAVRCGGILRRG